MVEYHLDTCDSMIGTMQRKIPAIVSMFACTHGMYWTCDICAHMCTATSSGYTAGTIASAVSSRARKQPKVTEPGVQGSKCQPPDGIEGPSASKCVERSERSAAASGSAPSGKPSTTALSKFVGRLRGSAKGARPCPKRAVGKTLRPSKQLYTLSTPGNRPWRTS